jgi:hypothetical protein
MIAAIYARKSTDQSGVRDEQRVKCDLLIEDRRP